jgi:D-sedoheptulose 7-phosphate isomerase
MKQWISEYVAAQKAALDSIPAAKVARLIELLRTALHEERHIFVFGNGGSAANASHFVTDLGKGSSDKLGRRFRCLSLNDNVSWMTALGNDYAYEDVFVRQLQNYGRKGDVVLALSVSGSSPNVVKAVEWANDHGLETIALVGGSSPNVVKAVELANEHGLETIGVVGGKRAGIGKIAQHVIAIDSLHYGRVEDAQMAICHMLCYAFIENPDWGKV